MMALASFILAFAGFSLLALSLGKHYRDLFGTVPSRRRERLLQLSGWVVVALSPLPVVTAAGLSAGITFWAGLLTTAALSIALLLAWRCR